MFKTLDELHGKPKVTPKVVAAAFIYVFLYGAVVGIFLGRGAWGRWEGWGELILYAALGWKILSPVWQEINKRLNNYGE